MFRTLDTHISEFSFSKFVIHRLTPLYLPYLSCYLLTIAFCISQDSLPTITGAGIFKYTYVLIDLLMMQNWGFSLPTCGDWFTSALVLASIIIFWLYKIVPSKRHVLFFSMIALLFSLVIFITHVNLQVHEARYHISSGVVRAIIGLSVGSVAYIYKKENGLKLGIKTLIICCGILLLFMFLLPKTPVDFLVLPVSGILMIAGTGTNINWMSSIGTIIAYLGSISYLMYLDHTVVRNFLLSMNTKLGHNVLLNVIVSIVVAIILNFFIKRIKLFLRDKN